MLKIIGLVCALALLGMPQAMEALQLAPKLTGKKYVNYIFLGVSMLIFIFALLI